jgi:hypothetical protein
LLGRQDGPVFLSNIIRGYVSMLGDEISLYLSEYINNAFTIENISYICQVLFPYAVCISEMIAFIVYMEVNVEVLSGAMPKTMAQMDELDTRLQGTLSKYFRLQNELKELLINRKRNYSIRGKDVVDAEIVAKLREEFNEYYPKKREIKNYVQNKIFQNYLRNKKQIAAVVEKKPKATKAAKKVEEISESVIIEEAPKRGRKKAVEVVEELSPAADTVGQKRSTRTTKKGGKKYKKSRKNKKTKKYRKTKK